MPVGPATWQTAGVGGERYAVEVRTKAVLEKLRVVAEEWSAAAGVKLGGEPEVHRFEPKMAKRMFNTEGRKPEPA